MKRILMITAVIVSVATARAEIVSTPPANGAACNDGMYSTSGANGTCSGRHGGVKYWIGRYAYKNSQGQAGAGVASTPVVAAEYGTAAPASYQMPDVESQGTMPTTGGEPFLYLLGGGAASLGAVFLRRRLG